MAIERKPVSEGLRTLYDDGTRVIGTLVGVSAVAAMLTGIGWGMWAYVAGLPLVEARVQMTLFLPQ